MDNKLCIPIVTADGTIGTQLSQWAISKNFVKLSHENFEVGEVVDDEKWYEIDGEKAKIPDGIAKIFFKITNNNRATIKLKLSKDTMDFDLMKLFINDPLCKRRPNVNAGNAEKRQKGLDSWMNAIREYRAGHTLPPYSGSDKSQLVKLFQNRII